MEVYPDEMLDTVEWGRAHEPARPGGPIYGGQMVTEPKAAPIEEWKVRRVGSTTFAISKPKRSRRKLRQMRLKNRRRAR